MTATATSAAGLHRLIMAKFLAFELRRVLRAPGFLVLALAFPVVMYLANYGNPTDNVHAQSSYGTSWPVYFMVSMTAWAAISAAFYAAGARMAAERANGWTRQLRLTPLPSWAYVGGKALAAESVALIAALVLAGVAGGAQRPGLSVGAWAALVLACWIGSLPLAAFGIFLGLIVSSAAAQPVMVTATLALNVFGGLLMPLQSFPHWLRDVARVLPSYRLGNLGWNVVAHRAFDPADVAVLAVYAALFTALAAWRYRADQARLIG